MRQLLGGGADQIPNDARILRNTAETIGHEEERFAATIARRSSFDATSLHPPPIVFPSGVTDDLGKMVYALFAEAKPKIFQDVFPFYVINQPFSQPAVDDIIREEISTTIEVAKSQPDSNVAFDVVSGKLTISSSMTVFNVKVTAGEVNVYKVSAVLAGGIVLCGKGWIDDFQKCFADAFAKVGSAIAAAANEESSVTSKDDAKK